MVVNNISTKLRMRNYTLLLPTTISTEEAPGSPGKIAYCQGLGYRIIVLGESVLEGEISF